jgi:hypothetical protein
MTLHQISQHFSLATLIVSMHAFHAGDTILYRVTLTNTGNIDFFDLDVDLGGGGGGNFSVLNCTTNSTGNVTTYVPATLLVANRVVCYLQYTVVQEDLEAGGLLLNTTVNSDLLSPTVAAPLEIAALQIVSVEGTYTVTITGEEPDRYTDAGKHTNNPGFNPFCYVVHNTARSNGGWLHAVYLWAVLLWMH